MKMRKWLSFGLAFALIASSAMAETDPTPKERRRAQRKERALKRKAARLARNAPSPAPTPSPALDTLEGVRKLVHGEDYLQPSADSLIGQYLAETGAKTTVRSFWRAPEGSTVPPHELGPKRLIVAVSAATFPVFQKHFGSKHFLFLLNEHGNMAAFKGKRSKVDSYEANWNGHIMGSEFTAPAPDRLLVPMLLDANEGSRAEDYFALAALYPNWRSSPARLPWDLRTKDGTRYSSYGAWATGCGTWIGNMPIGNELVDEYYFPSGDDGTTPARKPLVAYEVPANATPEAAELIRKVWKVPGHKQLAEIIDAGANRRGEFENAGWTSTTFIASASSERVPVIFLMVNDVKAEIAEEFKYVIDNMY